MSIIQTGDGWSVVDSNGKVLMSFRGPDGWSDAQQWIKDQDDIDSGDDTSGEKENADKYGFDWEGKFNLDLDALMDKYGVDSDMKKYFEGMEYDPQSESFLKGLFDVQRQETDLKRKGIGRQKEGLMGSLNENIYSALNQGEAASFQMNQASQQRGTQIGGMRGGSFADRFQSQATTQGIYGQQNQLFGQTEQKLGTMEDALTSLDLEAKQQSISFEQDIYGERQQWMDDFFARLMEVEQMEES